MNTQKYWLFCSLRQYTYFNIFSHATLNETFTAKCNSVLPRTPSVRPKSEIYTPKQDDEHPKPFYMRSASPPPRVTNARALFASSLLILSTNKRDSTLLVGYQMRLLVWRVVSKTFKFRLTFLILSCRSWSPLKMILSFNLTATRGEKRQGVKLCSSLHTICDSTWPDQSHTWNAILFINKEITPQNRSALI